MRKYDSCFCSHVFLKKEIDFYFQHFGNKISSISTFMHGCPHNKKEKESSDWANLSLYILNK